MTEYENMRTADIIAEALLDWNVDVIFGLPGDGINGFIEALRLRQNKIRFILVRHEESAAFMACAYAKYTGRLGVCVATSGPGAIHLLNGLYDAKADNTPVLAITGTTYSDLMNSNYQQDVNLLQLFSDVTVYNSMITVPEQAEMTVDIACRTALAQRGVSHLTIPIDVQEKKLSGKYSRHNVAYHTSDVHITETSPNHALIEKASKILNSGSKVVILAGQGALQSGEEVIAVAERLGAPVVKALLGKAVIPDDNVYSLGGIGLLGTEPSSDAMSEADTLFMIGTSFPYTDYLPKPGQARGIQIDIKAEKIGLRYPVEIGLIGDSKTILSELLPLLVQKKNLEFLKSKQQAMKNWNRLLRERSSRTDNPIKPQAIAMMVSEELEENAIISVDCGTNTSWAARYIDIRKGMKFSLSGTLSSMGNGLPYAIAAQIAFPGRQSVAFVGDGGLTMLMGEFATAVQYDLPIKVIVIKNNTLGMIRWEQMGFLGNPEYGVEFTPIDFAKFAEACGGKGYSIKKASEAASIIHKAMKENKPTLIEAYVDPFEPPMPPNVGMDYVNNLAQSFAKGQPYAKRIGLTLFRNKVHEVLKNYHTHS
ncbi:Putative thiamine pyrophosphate-containing protein YdaP [Candidatus Nitrosocosmicus oleophilus]|uniref:Thiamine pyrophosphate-containing protein YdaP n=1 Tax=Candidatus Nitrosocosmicus oleophilus TaxID=1353260 RepID=A0A654LWE1_9ARCH|nr:thiamine pyrophosphate-dependent enzyme [Candidatus Nitrosocosmicus oleophilus]ALI35525.1 Putative thiamine pyrophosphate-containing protein YdaP [Candidatus Nitrosocosmicus oleophilus]